VLGTGALVVASTPAFAEQPLKPAFFALPGAAFPPHCTVLQSHVEPNRSIGRDNILHFGKSFTHEGRLTGYFMDAIQGRRSSPHSDTSYLVSLFTTTEQASSAFSEQQYYWDALTSHGGSAQETLPVGAYGDPGFQALYSVRLPTGANFAELLFVRGPIFIEVFQEVYAVQPSRSELRAFFGIGSRLDVIARGEIAATAEE
jgi:hypothetical protein